VNGHAAIARRDENLFGLTFYTDRPEALLRHPEFPGHRLGTREVSVSTSTNSPDLLVLDQFAQSLLEEPVFFLGLQAQATFQLFRTKRLIRVACKKRQDFV
jgi:hypothetical protein